MCAIVFESPLQMYALVFHIVGIKLYNLKNMAPIETTYLIEVHVPCKSGAFHTKIKLM